MRQKSGGPAFPVNDQDGRHPGMSYRQWLAGQWLAGVASRVGSHECPADADAIADQATVIVDAMLERFAEDWFEAREQ